MKMSWDHAGLCDQQAGRGMKGGKYKAAICGGISMGVLGRISSNQARFDDVRSAADVSD